MQSDNRTLRAIVKELVDNPFFPILFIGEFAKVLVESGVGDPAYKFGILALTSIIIWVFSDVFTVELIKKKIIGIEDNN